MYYFIGIKGAGMSALAVILKQLGYEVVGSDVDKHFFTEAGLIENGIPFGSYNADNIKNGMTIIKGASIKDDNIELVKARELGLEIFEYNEMVGNLTSQFKTICVAGCHGKTTTTNMFSVALNTRGISYLIGDGTGYANRHGEYFALESCEYKRHFLAYHPYYAVITNIDLDHVDYFKNMQDVIDAYSEYANKAEKMVIACGDDPYTRLIDCNKALFYYGIGEGNDILAKNVEYSEDGTSFDVFVEDNYYGHFDLPFYGKHMVLNALAVISVCYYERYDAKEVARQLKSFKGAARRFNEEKIGSVVVIDDYAHHPQEVKVTLKAARQKYPDKKIVAVFQPHTFSRTQEFKDDIAKVLSNADASYVLDIFPAREKQEDYPLVTSESIIKETSNCNAINDENWDQLKQYNEDAVVIFMSPKEIKLMQNYKEYLKN